MGSNEQFVSLRQRLVGILAVVDVVNVEVIKLELLAASQRSQEAHTRRLLV